MVYAFGNRVDAAGVATPGPMNERLAEVVAGLVQRRAIPVHAQWEVAAVLASQHGLADVVAIEPDRDASGQAQHLSTVGVAEQVVKAAGSTLGKVGVVAWFDHSPSSTTSPPAWPSDQPDHARY